MNEKQDTPKTGLSPDGSGRDRMLKWFDFDHLSGEVRGISVNFSTLVFEIMQTIEPGPERTVCLRKLVESKDAAVRAVVHPGG